MLCYSISVYTNFAGGKYPSGSGVAVASTSGSNSLYNRPSANSLSSFAGSSKYPTGAVSAIGASGVSSGGVGAGAGLSGSNRYPTGSVSAIGVSSVSSGGVGTGAGLSGSNRYPTGSVSAIGASSVSSGGAGAVASGGYPLRYTSTRFTSPNGQTSGQLTVASGSNNAGAGYSFASASSASG